MRPTASTRRENTTEQYERNREAEIEAMEPELRNENEHMERGESDDGDSDNDIDDDDEVLRGSFVGGPDDLSDYYFSIMLFYVVVYQTTLFMKNVY